MMGGFLSRVFLLAFGYAYPAYECYKTVELNKPEIEQLLFWCQYWILVAVLTVLERFGDAFISWVPLYSEAKLAFFIYLWYPKTKGTKYIYEGFLRPYLAQHENDIDRNLLELRVRAGDVAVNYWQKAFTYSQTTFFDVLQYVASQSHSIRSRPTPAQTREAPPAPVQTLRRAKSKKASSSEENLPEASSSSSTPRLRRQLSGRSGPVPITPSAPPLTGSGSKPVGPEPGLTDPEPSAPPAIIEEEEAEEDVEMEEEMEEEEEQGVEANGEEETTMEEAIRMTRTRLRKRVGAVDTPGLLTPPVKSS
ncbi:hypothetical protein LUZ60_015197 [Juncus effusus]|nr:hypothetical protein LUZ60_015197 [Juncus effusus]